MERPGPEGGSDDLFEDLDKFFSSIEDEDWPEPIGPGRGPGTGSGAPGPEADKIQAEAVPEGDHDPGSGIEADAQPEPTSEIEAGLQAAMPGEAEMDSPPAAAVGATDEGPAHPGSRPGEPSGAGPGGEMTSAEWSRLRDVLGEDDEEQEEGEDEFPFSDTRGSATEESLFGYPGDEEETGEDFARMSGLWETGEEKDREEEPATEEAGELTIDDLRKAPPQYRYLPGPRDGTEGEPQSEALPADDVFEPAGATTGAEEASSSSSFGEATGGAFDEPDLESEPSLADVEAAADRVAGEFSVPEDEETSVTHTGPSEVPPEPDWLSPDYPEPPEPDEPEIPGGVDEDLLGDLAEPRQPRKVKVGEPESLLGPAWEDPTARTVGAEPPRGPSIGGRDLPVAFVSAVVLALVAMGLLAIRAWAFAVLAGAVVLVAQFELYTTTQRRGFHPATALGLVLGGLTLAGAYLKGEVAMVFSLALGVMLAFFWYMAAPPKAREGSLANIGVTLLGLLYVPFLAGFILLVLTLPPGFSGRALMLAVIGLTFLYDVVAFFIGSWYGSRPLAKTISPKKSWEGVAAATIVTILISIAFVSPIGPMTVTRAIGLALVVAILAPLGDLAESSLKRDLGVKDMGTIMPGHGGMLDRIDSLLFVAPAAFYFFRLIF